MKNDLMEVKNRLYPSKNNDIMLGQTIPLKAIVSNAAVKGAVAANAAAQAKAKAERDKFATMVMNPDFLTKKIDGRTTEPDNYGTPENTKRVEPVSTERTEKAAAAAGIAAAGSVIAAANSAAGAEQQSLFTEEPEFSGDGKTETEWDQPAEVRNGTAGGDAELQAVAGTDDPETVPQTEVKPVVIPVAEKSDVSEPVMGVGTAGPDSGHAVSTVAGQTEEITPEAPEQKRNYRAPKKKSGFWGKLLAIAVVLFLLVAGGVFYLFSSSKPDVIVADVNGKTVTEAKKVLEAQGFKVELENKVDPGVKPGLVLRMDPVAGFKRKEGATITLIRRIKAGAGGKNPVG